MASFFTSERNLDSPGPVQKLFTRDKDNFRYYDVPNIMVTSPNCGASGEVGNLNSVAGVSSPADLFPTLNWQFMPGENADAVAYRMRRLKEYLIVVEDLDGAKIGSSPQPIGIFYVIPADKNTITADDIEKKTKRKFERLLVAERGLAGGFKYGDLNGKVWRTPKSMHRIHFQVIALARTVDSGSLSEFPSKSSFCGAAEGAVLGWGEWVGVYKKK